MSTVNTLRATVTIGGVNYPVSMQAGIRIERTLGMSPNYTTIVLTGNYVQSGPGQINYPLSGTAITTGMAATIAIRDMLDTTLVFSNLTVHEVFRSSSGDGHTTTVSMKDARHVNRLGSLTGEFNIPNDGPVVEGQVNIVTGTLLRRRTVKQLVEECFRQMGRVPADYDVTALNGVEWYPPVRWEFGNPAAEIERLCSEIGMGVAYKRDGTYRIVVLGDLEGINVAWPFIQGNVPKRTTVDAMTAGRVYVVGGQTVREERLANLEPCGIDVDGTVKFIKHLSYAPNPALPYGGFENILPGWGGFSCTEGTAGISRLVVPTAAPNNVTPDGDAVTAEYVEGLAEQCIWRMYRYNPIAAYDRERRLPWLPRIVQTQELNGRTIRKEPIVYVKHVDEDLKVPTEYKTLGASNNDLKFTIDLGSGIVAFYDRVYLPGTAVGTVKPANVDVRIAYESAWYTTEPGQPDVKQIREQDFYVYPTPPTPPDPPGQLPTIEADSAIIRQPNLVLYQIVNAFGVTVDINRAELDEFAQAILDARLYDQPEIVGGDATVPRLESMDVNGAFHQIVWELSAGGATTTVTCNNERTFNRAKFMTYNERLDKGMMSRALDAFIASHIPIMQLGPRVPQAAKVASPNHVQSRSMRRAASNVTSGPNEIIPSYSFVEIASGSADNRAVRVKKPAIAIRAGIDGGVCVSGCAIGGRADVTLNGKARVKIDPAHVASVTVGSYVDSQPGSYMAVPGATYRVMAMEVISGVGTIATILLGNTSAVAIFRAKITGWSQIGAIRKWRYAWVEAELSGDTYQAKSGGRSGTTTVNYALNLREGANLTDHAGTQGNGVNEAGSSYPEGFHLVPIGGGTGNGNGTPANQTYVWMHVTTDTAGATRYEFAATNQNDGTCS